MVYSLPDKYISLLTDFGFKRVFGTEPNKRLLLDFLNTLLPPHHQIRDLTFKNTEYLGSTAVDRKAIFDIYCQAENGDRFIVEIQKAKQNFFKDRSVYYATFPIQEQAVKGEWDFELTSVYTVGVLDFVFDDHKDDPTFLHTVQLKNQRCEVFYDKLTFIYLELPKFTKSLDELESHFDKWLFLLKHLAQLDDRPQPLQEDIFNELFEVAAIANLSPEEQLGYQNSLKYYRDLNNVVDTARQEGKEEGLQEGLVRGLQAGRQEGLQEGLERGLQAGREGALRMLFRQLERRFGALTDDRRSLIQTLTLLQIEDLADAALDFTTLEELDRWLQR